MKSSILNSNHHSIATCNTPSSPDPEQLISITLDWLHAITQIAPKQRLPEQHTRLRPLNTLSSSISSLGTYTRPVVLATINQVRCHRRRHESQIPACRCILSTVLSLLVWRSERRIDSLVSVAPRPPPPCRSLFPPHCDSPSFLQ